MAEVEAAVGVMSGLNSILGGQKKPPAQAQPLNTGGTLQSGGQAMRLEQPKYNNNMLKLVKMLQGQNQGGSNGV